MVAADGRSGRRGRHPTQPDRPEPVTPCWGAGPLFMNAIKSSVSFFAGQLRIIGALMMRELATRFGREGLGFLWLIGEPLIFCIGVMIMWSATKPAYEHGIRIAPFLMTGYMALLLLRHQIGLSQGALQANIGLMHHRQISVLHLYVARNLLEIAGTTMAFIVVYIALISLRLIGPPHDLLLLYHGWFLLAWMGMGFALILAGIAMRYEFMERVVGLLSYILIPFSGAFFMVAWLPPAYRDLFLLAPFPHPIEMVRAGVFGEFTPTFYDASYALIWSAVFNIIGMALIYGARDRIDVE